MEDQSEVPVLRAGEVTALRLWRDCISRRRPVRAAWTLAMSFAPSHAAQQRCMRGARHSRATRARCAHRPAAHQRTQRPTRSLRWPPPQVIIDGAPGDLAAQLTDDLLIQAAVRACGTGPCRRPRAAAAVQSPASPRAGPAAPRPARACARHHYPPPPHPGRCAGAGGGARAARRRVRPRPQGAHALWGLCSARRRGRCDSLHDDATGGRREGGRQGHVPCSGRGMGLGQAWSTQRVSPSTPRAAAGSTPSTRLPPPPLTPSPPAARPALTASYTRAPAQAAVAPDGHPELTAPPVTQLLRALPSPPPLQPDLVPHLVPQSINMWMGAAPDGARGRAHRGAPVHAAGGAA